MVQYEKVPRTAVEFLDISLNIINTDSSAVVQIEPYRKPTSGKIPLAADSTHSPSTLLSWPKGELLRIRRQCRSSRAFRPHRTMIQQEFVTNGDPPDYLQHIFQDEPIARPRMDLGRVVRFVVRYNPCLEHSLRQVVARANRASSILGPIFETVPTLKLSQRAHG